MADGKPWNYDKVLLTPFYDILASLKLQRQLSQVQDKVQELLADEMEARSRNKGKK